MKLFRPRSILRLVLIGFSVVALPLIAALVTAVIYVDGLATQTRRAVFEAAHAMQASRMLVEQITAMERNARQFEVLGDEDLYQVYLTRRAEFEKTVEDLSRLALDVPQREQLDQLVARERTIFEVIKTATPTSDKATQAVAEFPALANLARAILAESSQLIGREVDKMQQAADKAQQTLLAQASAVIPAVLALAALFALMIARPLRQIDQAIRRLGAGEFLGSISVKGPQDLEDLGQRLEWLRTRLVELEAQKVYFLRHISHELKTPLTAIREGAELLADEVAGGLNDEQSEIAQILRANSLQLQKLIEDLLNFSVSRTPAPALFGGPVALDRLVERVLSDQKLAIKAKGLVVEKELSEVAAAGYGEHLRIILDNVVSNAVKYSPAGGRLRVAVGKRNGHATLDVQDEGPGIAPDERDRVFEAFYQGRAVPGSHVKGTGLGLAIAREYVKSHQGKIEIIDEARGAHLRVTLPLAAVHAR